MSESSTGAAPAPKPPPSRAAVHDLNNLLLTLLGNIQLALRENDPQQLHEELSDAEESARQAIEIVRTF